MTVSDPESGFVSEPVAKRMLAERGVRVPASVVTYGDLSGAGDLRVPLAVKAFGATWGQGYLLGNPRNAASVTSTRDPLAA